MNTSPPLAIDFSNKQLQFRLQRATTCNEAVAKAVGLKKNQACNIIDATAGLGKDAFILASLGASLILLERSKPIAALLRDALSKVADSNLRNRMQLVETEACEYLAEVQLLDYPDVIYCDPMFPKRQKSALVKKEMQYLQAILSEEDTLLYNEEALLKLALSKAKKRVVVKRPRTGPYIAGLKPSFSQLSKSNRFDIYLTPCIK